MIPYDSRTFVAKTVRVHAVGVVEVSLDLDFGVRLNRLITLPDMESSTIPDTVKSNAMHCLVVLLGGKQLIVQPDPESRSDWGKGQEINGRIYLDERVFGSPVGLTTGVSGCRADVLDISPYFESLRECGFEVSAVKDTLNKKVVGV
jgi:hypothetical protein